MNQSVKFVYFDIGGVFVNCNNSFANASSIFNIDRNRIDEFFDIYDDQLTKGWISANDFWQICVTKLNLPTKPGFNFADSWTGDYEPIKPTYDLAISLSKKFPIGIISNFYQGLFEQLLRKNFIPDIEYHSKILSCLVGHRKPESEIYQIAQTKAGVKPSEILFIDDRSDFLKPAMDLGWQTYKFDPQNPKLCSKEIKKITGLY